MEEGRGDWGTDFVVSSFGFNCGDENMAEPSHASANPERFFSVWVEERFPSTAANAEMC